jgi:hypothetical protein
MQVEAEHAAYIAFAEGAPWWQEPVTILLKGALQFIRERVLPRFEPFFDEPT